MDSWILAGECFGYAYGNFARQVCQVTVFYVIKEPATLPQSSIYRSKDPHLTIDDSSYSDLDQESW